MTDTETRINPGDDVTISGTVEEIWADGRYLIASKGTDGVTRRLWIEGACVKSVRPHGCPDRNREHSMRK